MSQWRAALGLRRPHKSQGGPLNARATFLFNQREVASLRFHADSDKDARSHADHVAAHHGWAVKAVHFISVAG